MGEKKCCSHMHEREKVSLKGKFWCKSSEVGGEFAEGLLSTRHRNVDVKGLSSQSERPFNVIIDSLRKVTGWMH